MNNELLQKVRDRIADKPLGYNQSTLALKTRFSSCGTACCVAGEAIIASQPTEEEGLKRLWELWDQRAEDEFGNWANMIAVEAARLLELTEDEANALFSAYPNLYWTRGFRERWRDVRRFNADQESVAREYAAIAVDQLDYLIKHGGF